MKTIIRLTLTCIFLLEVSALFSQTAYDDILAVNRTYHQTKSFSMNVRVSVFSNSGDKDARVVYEGSVKKDGECYYSEMMDQITLVNQRCFLTIDNRAKRMVYSEHSRKASLKDAELVHIVDSLVKGCSGMKLTGSSPGSRTYTLTPKGNLSIYRSIVVSIDIKKNVISQIIYYYVQGSQFEKVIINYSNILLDCNLPSQVFSESTFISRAGDEIKPGKAYRGYRVISRPTIPQ